MYNNPTGTNNFKQVEMEKEIKAAIVYQYYGKQYRYKNEFGTFADVVGGFHTGSHLLLDSFKLILKPLSAITDEDATEVAKMFTGTKGKLSEDGFFQCIDANDFVTQYFSFTRHQLLPSVLADFLRSRGYDISHYLLDGKTLHEAGLAIYTIKPTTL